MLNIERYKVYTLCSGRSTNTHGLSDGAWLAVYNTNKTFFSKKGYKSPQAVPGEADIQLNIREQ